MRKNHNQSRDYGQPGVMVEVTEADVQKHLRNRKFGTWLLDKVMGKDFARFRAENDAMVANDKAARAQRGETAADREAAALQRAKDYFKAPELPYPTGVIGATTRKEQVQPMVSDRPMGNSFGWEGPVQPSDLLPQAASQPEAGQGMGIHPTTEPVQHINWDPDDPALTAHQDRELVGSHR